MRKVRRLGLPLSLVVLAGGRSRRMGRDKALLPVSSGVLLERVLDPLAGMFAEVVVGTSSGRRVRDLKRWSLSRPMMPPFVFAVDEPPGQGPLGGILAGLRAAANDACFVVACDMPDPALSAVRAIVRRAANSACAIAVGRGGLVEPLFGVYERGCIPAIENLLASGRCSVLDLFDLVPTVFVSLGPLEMPLNINTPGDYRAFLGRVSR